MEKCISYVWTGNSQRKKYENCPNRLIYINSTLKIEYILCTNVSPLNDHFWADADPKEINRIFIFREHFWKYPMLQDIKY
jgi:hypothetical protein